MEPTPQTGGPAGASELRTRPLGIAIGICLGFVLVSALAPSPAGPELAEARNLPSFQAPVWIVLLAGVGYYPLFAAVLYRTLAHIPADGARRGIAGLLVSILAVNALWNTALGAGAGPGLGAVGAGLVLAAVAGAFSLLARAERSSALLLAPYLLWVLFEFSWSFELWRLNPS